jgi:zinc transporter ZupT
MSTSRFPRVPRRTVSSLQLSLTYGSRYIGILHLLLTSAAMGIALLATAAALAGAIIGISLESARHTTRMIIPFAGGVLMAISLVGLLPEVIAETGWTMGPLLFAAGYGLLRVINRHLFPVCPSCDHDHDHDTCERVLHGFTAPMVLAAAVHSTLDGWSIVTAQWAAPSGVRLALPLAFVLHKIPEGIALGTLLRAAVDSRWTAFLWCLLCEGVTLVGGAAALSLAPVLGHAWVGYPLAVAGGTFFYLGYHAVHGEWKRRGAIPAFVPAVTGAVGATVLQRGAEVFLR